MVILQIEHKIQRYDDWKKAFDNDPVGREKMGVKRYRVYHPPGDTSYVVIDLEFEDVNKAQKMLEALKRLWTNVEGKIMFDPKVRILEVADSKDY